MTVQRFGSREEARAAIEARLAKHVDQDVVNRLLEGDDLVTELISVYEEPAPMPGYRLDSLSWPVLGKAGIRYAIRNGDIDWIAGLMTGLASSSFVTLTTNPGALSQQGAVAALAAVYLWVRKIAHDYVPLEITQHAVLRALLSRRRAQGLTLEEIKYALEWHNHQLSVDEVDTILQQLCSIRRNDGTVISLVNQAADGKWSVVGV